MEYVAKKVLDSFQCDTEVRDLPLMSHLAWPPEKLGPISLILNQSVEPSAAAAESTLVM